jgi:hypothetical protein
MPKVDTKVIFPSNFIGNLGCPILQSMLNQHEGDISKVATNFLQNKKIGIILISGNIKELDFQNSMVDVRAKKVDALALLFGNDLNYPGANYDDPTHLLLSDFYSHIDDYFALPKMIQILIMGVEQTLLRRVVAVGQEIASPEDVSSVANKWIQIPKIRFQEVVQQEIEK